MKTLIRMGSIILFMILRDPRFYLRNWMRCRWRIRWIHPRGRVGVVVVVVLCRMRRGPLWIGIKVVTKKMVVIGREDGVQVGLVIFQNTFFVEAPSLPEVK